MNFYLGSAVKFAINLTAKGFSMDDDDFDIEVVGQRGRIKGDKGNTIDNGGKLVIFYQEPELSDSSSSSSSSDSSESPEPEATGQWFGIVDTTDLGAGAFRCIATAKVVDSNATGGIRPEIAKADLGNLQNP